MTTIYSYCLRYDDGAAPNPFWGVCTLVICKPKIRKAAQVGDWVIGFGSKNTPAGDLSERLVYMMKVTDKMTMEEYDGYSRTQLRGKIPDWASEDPRKRRGDSIYDFSSGSPSLRKSVHNEGNRKRDLGGEYAVLSEHFWYFGRNAIMLPEFMKNLIRAGQGHRSRSNDPWVEEFLKWISNFQLEPNRLYGLPVGHAFDNANLDQNVFPIPAQWKYKQC